MRVVAQSWMLGDVANRLIMRVYGAGLSAGARWGYQVGLLSQLSIRVGSMQFFGKPRGSKYPIFEDSGPKSH